MGYKTGVGLVYGECPHCGVKVKGYSASSEQARRSKVLTSCANKSLHKHTARCERATQDERDHFLHYRVWPQAPRRTRRG